MRKSAAVPAAAAASLDDPAARRFRRAILALLVVGLLGLVGLVAASFVLYGKGRDYAHWVDHTYSAESKINRLSTLTERIETARRGYLLAPRDRYWVSYVDTRKSLPLALDDLARHTADNPVQRAAIAQVRKLMVYKFDQLARTIEVAHAGDQERGKAVFIAEQEQQVTVQLRALYSGMLKEERRLLAIRIASEQHNGALLFAVTLSVAALLSALALGAAVLVGRYAADLRRSQERLQGLNEGLEDRVRGRTADLTRANEEIQRFAYIVSHDLRSPLVNVMGFTSEMEAGLASLDKLVVEADEKAPGLVTRDARAVIAEEIPEAIGFIRSSTRKMDRLINAILKLSREGRRTLNPEPLSMDVLATGVIDSLRHLADDRGAAIALDGALPDIVNDRVAIEQLLSNLTENAVKYLSPERPGDIRLRGRAVGSRAVFEVADNGRGIDARDHERVFELFRRSGQQDQVGEGIGLAHVRALVYRLGGAITVDSELGRGSTFRVDLPRRLEREDPSQAAA